MSLATTVAVETIRQSMMMDTLIALGANHILPPMDSRARRYRIDRWNQHEEHNSTLYRGDIVPYLSEISLKKLVASGVTKLEVTDLEIPATLLIITLLTGNS